MHRVQLKTGRESRITHSAQLALYTLMLRSTYGSDPSQGSDTGMLLYLSSGKGSKAKVSERSERALMKTSMRASERSE